MDQFVRQINQLILIHVIFCPSSMEHWIYQTILKRLTKHLRLGGCLLNAKYQNLKHTQLCIPVCFNNNYQYCQSVETLLFISGTYTTTSLPTGYFFMLFYCLLIFQNLFYVKLFQEFHQMVKKFGSRSAPGVLLDHIWALTTGAWIYEYLLPCLMLRRILFNSIQTFR